MTKDSTLCNCSRDLHHCASLALGITLRQHLEEKLKYRVVCAFIFDFNFCLSLIVFLSYLFILFDLVHLLFIVPGYIEHRCIFFPLVQCTYIGPTVHMHNFLLSFTQRALSFLHTTLIQTTLCLKTDQARPVLLLTGNHTHLLNLLIIWNDRSVIIIDQTTYLLLISHTAHRLAYCS